MARIRNATDLGVDLDRVADRPRAPSFGLFLEGSGPWDWEAWDHEGTRARRWPCAVCGGGPLRRTWYCPACDRAGTDGRVLYPGLPVGSHLNEDWEAEPTVYVRHPRLKGGLGDRVKGRKGGGKSQKAG